MSLRKNGNEKKILIYGCGNIGSRHLQGALRVNQKIIIYIYDKSEQSIKKAKSRLQEISNKKKINSVSFLKNFKKNKKFDLVILATTANNRYGLIKKIIDTIEFQYLIIEKIAFQSQKDFRKAIELINKNSIKAWVNCPNRAYNSYNKLKKILNKNDIITMNVDGGKWNLASNYIHYLDLFSFLIEDYEIKIILAKLNKPYMSKRKQFKEFDGYISAETNRGDHLSVNECKFSYSPITTEIFTKNVKIIIFESYDKAIILEKKNNWKIKLIRFNIEKQSVLTKYIIEDIFNQSDCKLIKVENSYKLHRIMLHLFLKHLKKYKRNISSCPIT